MSGDSVKEAQLFQIESGGAIPTSPLQIKKFRIKQCGFDEISWIFKKYHYKGDNMGGGISFCLALVSSGFIVGGAVIGKPRHEGVYGESVLDIRRMALIDECPKNSESYFLSKVIWFIKRFSNIKKVITYADRSVGHEGIIYKAANFKYIGDTAPSKHIFWNGKRYHPRSLTIDRPYSYELRKAIKTGEAKIETGLPKKIFEYIINEI